ncbi:MAG: hypothetical protein Kow0092_35960 [Deferrisomatales bacterium]
MSRIPRLLLDGETATYHVIVRAVLPGFPMGDEEKDYLLRILRRLGKVYFAELLGFCLMGDHVHLVVRMHTGEGVSDREMHERFRCYYGEDTKKRLPEGEIAGLRAKWASLSEYVREVKQSFSRWYNRAQGRRGFFWGERFKSLVVEDGNPLVHLLAYVDLNPVRAGLVERPEEYRWSTLGYHAQTGNEDGLLSLDFGLEDLAGADDGERLRRYRTFVSEASAAPLGEEEAVAGGPEAEGGRRPSGADPFLRRNRYFIDGGVIGSKEFVAACSRRFHDHFTCRHEKKPQRVPGLEGVYSLKRLRKGV